MEKQDYDNVELRLVCIGAECSAAENEFNELKAKQADAARKAAQLESKHDRLVEERRGLNQRRKVAVGLTFYELLEENGLIEILSKHNVSAAEYSAALRRVLREISPATKKPLAANMVEVIGKCLSVLQTKSE